MTPHQMLQRWYSRTLSPGYATDLDIIPLTIYHQHAFKKGHFANPIKNLSVSMVLRDAVRFGFIVSMRSPTEIQLDYPPSKPVYSLFKKESTR